MATFAVKCKGEECVFFRKSYGTQLYGGGYMPDFSIIEERCHHPKHYNPTALKRDFTGVHISSLKKCPLE
jgi:hypothetical protein